MRLACMFFERGIAPHFLQLIKFPLLGHHDVDDNIDVIDKHPLHVLFTFEMIGIFAAVFFHLVFY